MRKVSSLSDVWAIGSSPLEASALVSDVGVGDGEEYKPEVAEVGLYEGEVGEGGERESHGEETFPCSEDLYT